MTLFQEKIAYADFHLFVFKNQTVDSGPWERPCSERHHNTIHTECLHTRQNKIKHCMLVKLWEQINVSYFLETMHLLYICMSFLWMFVN